MGCHGVTGLGADGAAAPDWRNVGTSASPAVAAAWAGARSEAAGTAGRGRSGGPTPSTSSAPLQAEYEAGRDQLPESLGRCPDRRVGFTP